MLEQADIDLIHAGDAHTHVLRKQFSAGRGFGRQHNLCVEDSSGDSRLAAVFEEDGLARILCYLQRLLIIVEPIDGVHFLGLQRGKAGEAKEDRVKNAHEYLFSIAADGIHFQLRPP